jgi:hypothetical protein
MDSDERTQRRGGRMGCVPAGLTIELSIAVRLHSTWSRLAESLDLSVIGAPPSAFPTTGRCPDTTSAVSPDGLR